MRIILYVMDGLSARKIRSYNDQEINEDINKNIPLTYIDELYKKGFSAKNCYGFDTTLSSFFAFMTGKKHSETRVSIARNVEWLDYNKDETLASLFKNKGFRTHYYTNNCIINKAILLNGFEKQLYDYENYLVKPSNISEDFDEYFGLDGKDIFLTFHDFYTHDQDGKYSKGKLTLSGKEYEELIVQHAENLKYNLNAINFDETKDYLFLISDHGLTVDSSVFKDKGDDESLWSLNSKELKSRVMCNIVGPDIESFEFENVCSLREVFFTFVDKFNLSEKLKNKDLNLLNRPLQEKVFSINTGNAAIVRPAKTTFHQFMGVSNDKKKWIYQDNIERKAEYYDLKLDPFEKNLKELEYNNLPNDFKVFIEEYQNSRKISINLIVAELIHMKLYFTKSYIKHIIKNYKKIPNAIMKIIRNKR